MIPVQSLMPVALTEILRKAPLTPEKVAFAWRSAVGVQVHNATEIALENGVLHVRAKEAAWQREIERSAAVIRDRLDALLGAGVVRYINVMDVGTPATLSTSPRGTATAASAPAAQSSRSADESDTARRRR